MDLDTLRLLVEYKTAIIERARKVAEETERLRTQTQQNQADLMHDLLSAMSCVSKYADQLIVGTGGRGYYSWEKVPPGSHSLLKLYPDGSWKTLVGGPHSTCHDGLLYNPATSEVDENLLHDRTVDRVLKSFLKGIKELTEYTEYDKTVKEKETASCELKVITDMREAMRQAITEAYDQLCREQLPE